MRPALRGLFLVLLASWAMPASAGGRDRAVGVLPVVHSGDIAAQHRGDLLRETLDSLEDAGISASVLEPPSCATPQCLRELAQSADLAYVIRVRAVERDRSYELTVDVVAAGTGEVVASTSSRCEICGWTEVEQRLRDTVAQVVGRIEISGDAVATLVVDGEPGGADVSIDGTFVGKTPTETPMDPGQHRVRIAKSGYSSQEWEWPANAGVREHFRYRLSRSDEQRTLRPLWGALALGAGVAIAASGATLIGLHGRPHARTCPDGRRDEDGDCPNVYATMGAGVTLTIVGVAGIGAGIGLLVRALQGGKRAEPGAPTIEATASGVRGRF